MPSVTPSTTGATRREGIWITKGTKSREKHETGRCFRAFREISWYSCSRFYFRQITD